MGYRPLNVVKCFVSCDIGISSLYAFDLKSKKVRVLCLLAVINGGFYVVWTKNLMLLKSNVNRFPKSPLWRIADFFRGITCTFSRLSDLTFLT